MTPTDYRQFYRVCERAGAELRGLAKRLQRERDDDAGAIVESAINELDARLRELLALWRADQEPEHAGRG